MTALAPDPLMAKLEAELAGAREHLRDAAEVLQLKPSEQVQSYEQLPSFVILQLAKRLVALEADFADLNKGMDRDG